MQAKVSFTQKVKEEVCTINFSDEHLRSLLAAFIKVNGSISLSNKKRQIVLRTENSKIAKFIYLTIERLYGVPCHFAYTKMMNFNKRISYNVVVSEADYILSDLEISLLEGKIAKNIVLNDDMISGYLGGAFLASGSVNSPKKSNYHLEISLNSENYAKWFSKLFAKYRGGEFNPKIIKRRNQFVVYLKRSAQITDFLILIGATNTALEFENVRVSRDFANIGNRLSNLDAANLAKCNKAAMKQIEDIKIIDEVVGIDNIKNHKMRELMKLRLDNDDMSLSELASKLKEILKENVSRSSVNHMFHEMHNKAIELKKAKK